MSRQNVLKILPPAILRLSVAAAANGAESGFYLGADLGRSDYPASAQLTVDLPSSALASGNLSNLDLASGITGGYRFNRYAAVEAGYVDLGTRYGQLMKIGGIGCATGHFDFSVRGATQAVVGILPFGQWEGYVKLGYLYSDFRLSYSGIDNTGAFKYKVSVSDLSVWAGLGLRYPLSQNWQIDVEYDGQGSVGDREKTGQTTNSTPSIGLAHRF